MQSEIMNVKVVNAQSLPAGFVARPNNLAPQAILKWKAGSRARRCGNQECFG